jgi:acyl-CoA-binding protein
MSNQFLDAQTKLKTLTNEPDNDAKLKLYALFKQVNLKIFTFFQDENNNYSII